MWRWWDPNWWQSSLNCLSSFVMQILLLKVCCTRLRKKKYMNSDKGWVKHKAKSFREFAGNVAHWIKNVY